MGMDFVELILATEEAFDIEIPDDEARHLETVRQLADYVAQRVPLQSERKCRTQRSFYRVRQVLARLQTPRTRVTPMTDLYALKPVLAHPEVWPLVGTALGATEWPNLPRAYAWRKLTPATSLPYGLRTPGEVARHVATCQLERPTGPWTREEVLLRVRQLVMETLEETSFPDYAHFVHDLGVD